MTIFKRGDICLLKFADSRMIRDKDEQALAGEIHQQKGMLVEIINNKGTFWLVSKRTSLCLCQQ